MKNRYGKLLLIFVLFLISSLAFTPAANAMGSVARDEKSINLTNTNDEIYRIEQVRVVMPYVRAYFYPDDSYKNATEVKGKLGDKELTMTESKTWKETAYGIDYYFLIDNSKSVSSADFEEVKKEIADTADTASDELGRIGNSFTEINNKYDSHIRRDNGGPQGC